MQTVAMLLDSVRPGPDWVSRDAVHQVARRSLAMLAQDRAELEHDAGFLFSHDDDAAGADRRVLDLIRRWHIAERPPGLASLCIFAIENLKLDLPPEIQRGVLAAGMLGEVENNLPYHNTLHYKKVLLQVMRLIDAHNRIYDGMAQAFDGRQAGLILMAACIHDLGHDGKGNTIKGVFEQGRLERRAFKLAEPYLEACGMGQRDLDDLLVMMLCTDVTPLGDPANPASQMKSAYRYHFMGEKKKIEALNLDPELSALEKNPTLAMMALVLHEADIGTSAGLDYNLTTYESTLYRREMGERQAFPKDVANFLRDVCQREMISDAGKKLFAANMARVLALAERDVAEGNRAYPQPESAEFLSLHAHTATGNSTKTIN
jgi:hypothetical protein